jgi:hypothetical protein
VSQLEGVTIADQKPLILQSSGDRLLGGGEVRETLAGRPGGVPRSRRRTAVASARGLVRCLAEATPQRLEFAG